MNLFGVQVNGHNQAIKTQDFGEDQNKNHTNKKSRLLSGTSYTCITNNSNGETSCQSWESDS